MKEYFKAFPFSENNKISKQEFDLKNGGYIKITDSKAFDGAIIEKWTGKDIELVSFISNSEQRENLRMKIPESYQNIDYEIEYRITSSYSIIFRRYVKKNQEALIIRQFNPSGLIVSESSFCDGSLLQYDEILYDRYDILKETRTFLGKNAWTIERKKYEL